MKQATPPEAFDLAVRHHNAGRLQEAAAIYRRILQADPRNADALHLLGVVAGQQGRNDVALDLIRRSIALQPNCAEAHANLGNVFKALGQLDAAVAAYRHAIGLNPQRAVSYSVLGNALKSQGQLPAAIAAYQQAIALDAHFAAAYANLGDALLENAQADEAVAVCRRALELDPHLFEAHHNMALALLTRGDLAQGWSEYEWRSKRDWGGVPQWDGLPLEGRTLLLHAEQGFGDTLQFIRYFPMVAQRGGRIVVECQPALWRLLAGSGLLRGASDVIERGAALPRFDVQCPLMSLPAIFGTTLSTIPAIVPYLEADSRGVEMWRSRLGEDRDAFKVGLVWAGSAAHANDYKRSIAPPRLDPLGQLDGVRFVSLQKGNAARSPAAPPMCLLDFMDEMVDFADTAALIAHLDLVISVDTAAAHLAAALGNPVWTLLTYGCDWRWLRDRDDSPWYPTMRLFRQRLAGDWDDVMQRVAEALKQLRSH